MSDRSSWTLSRALPLRRLLALVEGDLAPIAAHERERLVAWQELRLRIGLGHLFSLLAVLAACKVALVVGSVWSTALPPLAYAGAFAALVAMRFAYGRARGLLGEAVSATVFLIALMMILADSSLEWTRHPGLALGWVWLLGSLGIPLLARLQSVVVFCLLLIAAVFALFALVPMAGSERLQILLYLSISIGGGLLLRRLRSDTSLQYRRAADAVTAAANTDALTSLANRRGWRQQAPALLAECALDDTPISLLFIDLDHFKTLNDEHGHAAGDSALRRVGKLLNERMDEGLAARLGGEEFVCLLPGMDEQAAATFAESLRQSMKRIKIPLTFSGGIACWQPGESLPDLLARGDTAMYRAKENGRDQIVQG